MYSSETFIGKIRETKKIITYLYLIIAVRSMINFYSSQMVFAAQQQVALNNIRLEALFGEFYFQPRNATSRNVSGASRETLTMCTALAEIRIGGREVQTV